MRQVGAAIGDSQLVWFGTRGDDVESIADLEQFAASVTILSGLRSRSTIESVALENFTRRRPDLDTFDIDAHPRDDDVVALRRALLRLLSRPSFLFTYRPSTFVSAVCFARRDRCRYLGPFSGHQAAFEHKPWVETSVAQLGVPHVPWRYVADDDQLEAQQYLQNGPLILRRSRTTGGVGFLQVDDASQLPALWPAEEEAFVSVAPFIDGGLPLNVGGVVWRDGVTVHPASLQLIGISSCTSRPFGYCGNDFAAVRDLDQEVLNRIERSVIDIGGWMLRSGYRGAFGVDFLIKNEEPLFLEINPRFQGSTHLSCQLTTEGGESGLMLEHLAACLDLSAPPSRHLSDFANMAGDLAHFVVHSVGCESEGEDAEQLLRSLEEAAIPSRSDAVLPRGIIGETGCTVARVTVRNRVTKTGFELYEPWATVVSNWQAKRMHDPVENRTPA